MSLTSGQWPSFVGGCDLENGFDPDHAVQNGLTVDSQFSLLTPTFLEDVLKVIELAARSQRYRIIVYDSLAMALTSKDWKNKTYGEDGVIGIQPALPTAVPPTPALPTATTAPALPTALPATATTGSQPATSPTPPTTSSLEGFDPAAYIGWGNKYNCGHFKSEQQAQLVLRADPSDPNRMDGNKDGIACESRPAPQDRTPVPTPTS